MWYIFSIPIFRLKRMKSVVINHKNKKEDHFLMQISVIIF